MLKSLLSLAPVYRGFASVIGAAAGRDAFVREHVRPRPGDRILDIGCGPGVIVPHLPDVQYVGFDASREYIEAARQKYGDRATFVCERVSSKTLEDPGTYDLVLAVGILHHLDDAEAAQLFELADAALKPGGRLITLDNCYTKDQSFLARWIISHDRGEHVRAPEGYVKIGASVFPNVQVTIREDLLRIPYTWTILECDR